MPFTPQSSDSDFQALQFSSAQECKSRLGNMLADNRSLKFSLEECTSKGRVLWIGIKDGIVVAVACTSQAKIANYFFELKDNEVAISRCETHLAYRGSGLYARTLQVIINELSKEGIHSFYIDCFEWNWPSSRGIEKAGFKLIGYGRDKKGTLTFKPL
jgi:RimJ/RimL family protein N-acetyltransferase